MASTISSTCPSAVLLAFTTPDEATDDRSFSVSGTLTKGAGAPLSGATIAIDEAGSSIGSAVVGSNGTWSAAILLPDLGTNTLIASYVDGGGVATMSAPLTLTLDTVLSPPSSLPGTGQAINVVRPAFDGTVFGTAGVDDFVFRSHPGHTTVEGFDLSSPTSDRLSLPTGRFDSLAEVLRHTTMTGDSAVIHLDPRNSITLVGVSKSELQADRHAIGLHS